MASLKSRYQQLVRNAFDVSFDLLALAARKLSKRPFRKLVHEQFESELQHARNKSWRQYYKVMAERLHNDLD